MIEPASVGLELVRMGAALPAGTVCSGLVYQIQGLEGCLWWSAGFVLAAFLLSIPRPAAPSSTRAMPEAIPKPSPTTLDPARPLGRVFQRAGLKPGDLVLALDDRPIASSAELRTRLGLMRAGTEFELTVLRLGKRLTIQGEVEDPYADFVHGERVHPQLEGALLGEAIRVSKRGKQRVVQVGPLRPGSPAWSSGLREGDLVCA